MKLILTALAAARLLACADFALPDLLPPDAKFVIGIRVRSLLESALVRSAGGDANALSDAWLKQAALTGFDPLNDLDEALITSPADRENAPTLILLHGRFNLQKLEAGAERYHGVALLGAGKGSSGVLAELDSSTAIGGDPALVRAAIDRYASGVAAVGALVASVQSMRERFDIWGTGERPEGFVAPAGASQQLDSIDRFQFGVRVTSGLELTAELHARSQADVQKLSASLDLLRAMMKMQAPQSPKIDVQFHDSTWKISVAVSEQEIQKAIAAQRGSLAKPPAKPTPKPATPGGLTISGQAPAPSQAGGSTTTVITLPGKH